MAGPPQQELTKQAIRDLRASLSQLENEIVDNKVTAFKARSTALVSALGTLNTALQACSSNVTLT